MKKVAETVKVHENHMMMTDYGILVVVASCVFPHVDNRHSIYENIVQTKKGVPVFTNTLNTINGLVAPTKQVFAEDFVL